MIIALIFGGVGSRAPASEAIPVFFHNSSVSAGMIAKSDSRRSGVDGGQFFAAVGAADVEEALRRELEGRRALVDSESESSRLSPGPTISTGTPFSFAVRNSTNDPTL